MLFFMVDSFCLKVSHPLYAFALLKLNLYYNSNVTKSIFWSTTKLERL